MSVTYRRPEVSEADVMAALHVQCWREAYRGIVPNAILDAADAEKRATMWRSVPVVPDRFVTACFEGELPIGFVIASPNAKRAVPEADGAVLAIYVLARCQRHGIGRNLLKQAASWWLARGGQSLEVQVLADNRRAHAFYVAMGGRLAGTGTSLWDEHPLPDTYFVFENLEALAAQ